MPSGSWQGWAPTSGARRGGPLPFGWAGLLGSRRRRHLPLAATGRPRIRSRIREHSMTTQPDTTAWRRVLPAPQQAVGIDPPGDRAKLARHAVSRGGLQAPGRRSRKPSKELRQAVGRAWPAQRPSISTAAHHSRSTRTMSTCAACRPRRISIRPIWARDRPSRPGAVRRSGTTTTTWAGHPIAARSPLHRST